MIVDTDGPGRARFAQAFDVCIIGAGPTGITLARRLAASGANVALMEGGGLDVTVESQAIYEGTNAGLDYFPLDVARLRFLGGSSNHWAGWCRQLDDHDFEPKAWNPRSGWPITKADLDPYSAEADAILDLPPAPPDLPFEQAEPRFRRVQFRFSPPTRFKEKYQDELDASSRIALGLNANLVDLRLDDEHARVTEARFRGYAPDDPGFRVRAHIYCLATGGIENPRLLLNFRSQELEGIGNRNGLVGRYFCEHPHFVLADVLLRDPINAISFHVPTRDFYTSQQTLNFGLRIEPAHDTVPVCGWRTGDFETRLKEAFTLPATDCPLPGAAGRIRFVHEQALNPDSRIQLGQDTDALGLRRPILEWRLGERDIHTMRAAVMGFGQHIAEQDSGRLRLRDFLIEDPTPLPDTTQDEVAGKHHMGTTRMAESPRDGVVDRDCRVHGIDNLYIGGSSVFATPGHANPTYTIVQLTLRLGDHLNGRLAG